ncbi:MAG: hypothetical protein CJBNEKGG_03413 [Prosthecobacter sp.]|nr:hypothetical protein [Prosthecobacter sp.]
MPRLIIALVFFTLSAAQAESWWNPKWSLRKKLTIDTTESGSKITDAIGTATVLVRLHDGNFQFMSASEDGADLRFIAADGRTELSHHIEKFDSLLNEAFVWVKVPDVKPGAQTSFWLYYGHLEGTTKKEDARGTYDDGTALVLHFSEGDGLPADSSGHGVRADKAGIPVGGALIAGALRFTGQSPVSFPSSPGLEIPAGGSLAFSTWFQPLALQPDAVILAWRNEGSALLIGENNGAPYVEVVEAGKVRRSTASEAVAVNAWHHLAVVADAGKVTLYLDGKNQATLDATLPALKGAIFLGKDSAGDRPGFSGELDELRLDKVARPAGWIHLAAINQGTGGGAQKLLVAGEDEADEAGHSELAEHLSLFVSISKSLTFDGWVVIALCAILALVAWFVTISKLLYLNRISRASQVFLGLWAKVSTDITALDHADEKSIRSLGGTVSGARAGVIRQSPLFHIYHLGSQEIQKRIDASAPGAFRGLSGRSIQAIRAALDAGQELEVEKLHSKLVFLTIGIAGGPYLGLLGTVIGVMITFAVIAQSGEVDINSIAPGIAGALLATVAGLAVAIPSLFAYSYLSTRIRQAVRSMHIFIDEFITRIAEAYPTANE